MSTSTEPYVAVTPEFVQSVRVAIRPDTDDALLEGLQKANPRGVLTALVEIMEDVEIQLSANKARTNEAVLAREAGEEGCLSQEDLNDVLLQAADWRRRTIGFKVHLQRYIRRARMLVDEDDTNMRAAIQRHYDAFGDDPHTDAEPCDIALWVAAGIIPADFEG